MTDREVKTSNLARGRDCDAVVCQLNSIFKGENTLAVYYFVFAFHFRLVWFDLVFSEAFQVGNFQTPKDFVAAVLVASVVNNGFDIFQVNSRPY